MIIKTYSKIIILWLFFFNLLKVCNNIYYKTLWIQKISTNCYKSPLFRQQFPLYQSFALALYPFVIGGGDAK